MFGWASQEGAAEEGALARFNLVPDIPAATRDGNHSYSAYVYAENDVVSGHLQKEKFWEAGYIVNMLDQLHQFAKVRWRPVMHAAPARGCMGA